jgi:hypothetical protein
MKLNLTTWQRLMIIQALNAQSGHISILRTALKLLEILELSMEEQAEVGLVQQPDGGLFWRDTERRFEIAIDDRELAAFLKRAVAAYQGWPVGQAAEAIDLFEQFGIDGGQ